MYNVCPRCGHAEHISHGSVFCRQCGEKLVSATDPRDVVDEEKIKKYGEFLKLKRELGA